MVNAWWRAKPLGFEIGTIVPTNPDGRTSKRVATVPFHFGSSYGSYQFSAVMTADIDAKLFQDESTLCRLAGRRLVPWVRQGSRRIGDGQVEHAVELTNRAVGIWRFSVEVHDEEPLGGRHLIVRRDIRNDSAEEPPEIDVTLIREAGAFAKRAAETLHAALDDPDHYRTFGRP